MIRDTVTLEELCIPNGIQTGPFGSQLKAEEYESQGVPVFMPQDIISGKLDRRRAARIGSAKAEQLRRHTLRTGDIVFSRRGDLSKIAVVSEEEAGSICGTGCLRARPRPEHNADYLRETLLTERTIKWLNKHALGQTMLNLSTEIVAKLPLFLPRRSEQDAIFQFTSRWQHAITLTERLIAAKQQLRRGLVQQLLTGKRRFPGFSAPWWKVRLGDVTNECTERNRGALGRESVRAVTNSVGMVPMQERLIAESIDRYKVVQPNGFAYNPMRINVGSLCMWTGTAPALVSPDYVVFECNPDQLDPRYFDILRDTHHWDYYMQAAGNGSVRVRIWYDDLAALQFTLPPIEEQRRIAAFFLTLDHELALLKTQLIAIKTQKRGLMQQLLTGKVCLPLPLPLPTAEEAA